MEICQATTPEQIALSCTLFDEYAAWLGIDLSFQRFDVELADLPGVYAPPRGRLLLAIAGDQAEGCVALRPLEDTICEMKHLFVRPVFRRQGLGSLLVERVIQDARIIGYSTMRLDTLPFMQAAIRLYKGFGFTRCPAYYETLLKDTVFMELQLGKV